MRLVTLSNPAMVAITTRQTEGTTLLDPLLIKLRQAVLNIDSFLSRVLAHLIENSRKSLLSKADL